jgi:AraC-like DNA-binding protein
VGSRSIDEPSIGICELRGLGTRAGEVRFGIVRQLVADTDLPSAEIAAALDFSEPAAFTRAFHQWARRAPREWRVRAIHGSHGVTPLAFAYAKRCAAETQCRCRVKSSVADDLVL